MHSTPGCKVHFKAAAAPFGSATAGGASCPTPVQVQLAPPASHSGLPGSHQWRWTCRQHNTAQHSTARHGTAHSTRFMGCMLFLHALQTTNKAGPTQHPWSRCTGPTNLQVPRRRGVDPHQRAHLLCCLHMYVAHDVLCPCSAAPRGLNSIPVSSTTSFSSCCCS